MTRENFLEWSENACIQTMVLLPSPRSQKSILFPNFPTDLRTTQFVLHACSLFFFPCYNENWYVSVILFRFTIVFSREHVVIFLLVLLVKELIPLRKYHGCSTFSNCLQGCEIHALWSWYFLLLYWPSFLLISIYFELATFIFFITLIFYLRNLLDYFLISSLMLILSFIYCVLWRRGLLVN